MLLIGSKVHSKFNCGNLELGANFRVREKAPCISAEHPHIMQTHTPFLCSVKQEKTVSAKCFNSREQVTHRQYNEKLHQTKPEEKKKKKKKNRIPLTDIQ